MKAPLIKNFLVSIILAGLLGSCSKGGAAIDDGPTDPGYVPDDVTAPQVTINTPTTDQVFSNGATISITGKITDDYGLYRGTIKITDDANGYVVMNKYYEVHGLTTYNFNTNHTANVVAVSNYTVTVSFEDHGYNTRTSSVKIKVNP